MPKHDLENSNMLCVQGKCKTDIPCPAIMNFCKVSGCKIMVVKYGQIFYLVPGGLALFQPVFIQTGSLALLLWADRLYPSLHSYWCLCSGGGSRGSCYAPILASLWDWASVSSLNWCTQAGSGRPVKNQIVWGIITEYPAGGLQLLVSITVSQEACVAFVKVFHK